MIWAGVMKEGPKNSKLTICVYNIIHINKKIPLPLGWMLQDI